MEGLSDVRFNTVDEYLSALPVKARKHMDQIRLTVKHLVPEAEEVISYNMPAFKFHGMLLYYAAHQNHIGFYPGNSKLVTQLKEELKTYETSIGTIKFPLDKPLPIGLIKKIVEQRAKENLEKAQTKIKKKI